MSGTPTISPRAGQPALPSELVDLPALLGAYERLAPDPAVASQRVQFGTSGHRGCSLDSSFNRAHILAITWAICAERASSGINGPLFIGFDSHALSLPAFRDALEVLVAAGVTVMTAKDQELTPTPAVSHAILGYNRGRSAGLADGIVITPSHNPPREGGFKYNPPHGGPAGGGVTGRIQARANEWLARGVEGIARVPFERALRAARPYDFRESYVAELGQVIDLEAIRASGLAIGVDPMGGAGVHYWGLISERYGLGLTVLNTEVDPSFRFMTCDWDGKIRMDPSSRYAMQSLLSRRQDFDLCVACDTDHDRHGIVTRTGGLVPANDYLAVMASYLFRHRTQWGPGPRIGKTVVSSRLIERVGRELGREVYEVPVGFKWFVDGLLDGGLGFAGEESAGASFLRKDGRVWTTDKDGIVPALLAAEMTARQGRDPTALYGELTSRLGKPVYRRIDAPATAAQRARIAALSPEQVAATELAGEAVERVLTRAPGNGAAIGGLKIETRSGWLAARPSGTEDVYKVYAESFLGEAHLEALLEEGQRLVGRATGAGA